MYMYNNNNYAGPLLEALSAIDPLNNTDAVVYGMGAVKLISTNQKLRSSLKEVGVVKMLANYLGSCQVSPYKHVKLVHHVSEYIYLTQGDSVLPSTIIVQVIVCKSVYSVYRVCV